MAALDRAFALAQVDAVAVVVGQHLDLDMPRARDQLLQVDVIIAKGAQRFAPRRCERTRQLLPAAPPRACPCRRRRPKP